MLVASTSPEFWGAERSSKVLCNWISCGMPSYTGRMKMLSSGLCKILRSSDAAVAHTSDNMTEVFSHRWNARQRKQAGKAQTQGKDMPRLHVRMLSASEQKAHHVDKEAIKVFTQSVSSCPLS